MKKQIILFVILCLSDYYFIIIFTFRRPLKEIMLKF